MINRVGPDGKPYQFPAGTSEEKIESYFRKKFGQRGRAFVQGVTFGFGEEIEAFARSIIPGGPEYKEIRDELREKLAQYRTTYPGEALSVELAGALVPALATFGAGTLASAATTGARVAPTASRSALDRD